MKDNDQILNLQETEELCRLYLECQLSVLEERELQYILGKLDYSSPIIDEARQAMIAEGLLSPEMRVRKKPKYKWMRLTAGIAAALMMVISLSIFIMKNEGEGINQKHQPNIAQSAGTSTEMIIAYEGGKKLSPEDSEKAVNESIKKAEELMAMAQAQIKEDELRQEYFINLISDKK